MKTLEEILAELPEDRRAKIKARTDELIAEEMTLRQLRKAMSMTQVEMAETLGIAQEGVSRLENRSDMLLSTLSKCVKSLGGELALVITFPDRGPVVLKSAEELESIDAAE